jgi:hypothetical protein
MELKNIRVYNLKEAIRASKFPMAADISKCTGEITNTVKSLGSQPRGSAHDNFLHGIVVSYDLTCSNKMWVEFERYHFANIVSGQSTMHCVSKLADNEDVFNPYITDNTKQHVNELLNKYNESGSSLDYLTLLYNIPSGIELTDHIVTNYGQLKTMYQQRHNHRLPEWKKFCSRIIELPYFQLLTGLKNVYLKEDKADGKNCNQESNLQRPSNYYYLG